MYWFAKKQNGEVITLTEREALVHTEHNNISTRKRLEWIGVTEGKHQAAAQEAIRKLILENVQDGYEMLSKEDKKVAEFNARQSKIKDVKKILDEAMEKEIEEAKKNGFKQPRKSLHVHTPHGERDTILKTGNFGR